MILFGCTDNYGILLGTRESRYEPWGSSIQGAWFSSWYVISINTGHIAQSPQSGPRWSSAFEMEPVLSVSSFNQIMSREENWECEQKWNRDQLLTMCPFVLLFSSSFHFTLGMSYPLKKKISPPSSIFPEAFSIRCSISHFPH